MNRFKTTFTRISHLPGCPAPRQAIIDGSPCDLCEMRVEEVPAREALTHIFETIGKPLTEAELTEEVRKRHASLN